MTLFDKGFLGTNAPLFMDLVTIIVALLPLLILISIKFAKDKKFKLHIFSQTILYVITLIVVLFFEYGVRKVGGFNAFMQSSKVSYNYSLIVLIMHILISIYMLFIWSKTIFLAFKNYKSKTLPGVYSAIHIKNGKKSTIAIILSSLTGIWVYLLLFTF